MKYAIVSSKDLGLDCWSPRRFTNSCKDCDRIMKCKLPEGLKGQLTVLEHKIMKAQENIKKWENQILNTPRLNPKKI